MLKIIALTIPLDQMMFNGLKIVALTLKQFLR